LLLLAAAARFALRNQKLSWCLISSPACRCVQADRDRLRGAALALSARRLPRALVWEVLAQVLLDSPYR
jgi:hypothetical protein